MNGADYDEIVKRGWQKMQEEKQKEKKKEDIAILNACRIMDQLQVHKNAKATTEELFQSLEAISFMLKEHNFVLPQDRGWENLNQVKSELFRAHFLAQQTLDAATSAELSKVMETTPPPGVSTNRTTTYALRIVQKLQEKKAYELIKRKK